MDNIQHLIFYLANAKSASMDAREPYFTFAEVLEVTGADNAWLRTFIQRDKDGRLGTKHRTGRLLFSLNDIMAIALLYRLNARLRVAPAAVWEILDASNCIISDKDKPDSATEIRVGFDASGGVLVWTRTDGPIETWNDLADENQFAALQADREPHIVIPLSAILLPAAKAVQMADNSPEGDRE